MHPGTIAVIVIVAVSFLIISVVIALWCCKHKPHKPGGDSEPSVQYGERRPRSPCLCFRPNSGSSVSWATRTEKSMTNIATIATDEGYSYPQTKSQLPSLPSTARSSGSRGTRTKVGPGSLAMGRQLPPNETKLPPVIPKPLWR